MRLWHKDLIPYLPRPQLLGQWRECCAIAKNISTKGSPNHILVNKIMSFPIEHFRAYARRVYLTARIRGFAVEWSNFTKYLDVSPVFVSDQILFDDWHDTRYLRQCFYNLEEKYDCGGLTDDEWHKIRDNFIRRISYEP
ncbi:MAG: hypothetical protein IJG87_06350 [Ruminococcus sp.]|nr:hypothetical protein [Ruminococcus sp.]